MVAEYQIGIDMADLRSRIEQLEIAVAQLNQYVVESSKPKKKDGTTEETR
jgi:hypothetical protein